MSKEQLLNSTCAVPLRDLTIVNRPIASLKKRNRNARRHSKKQIRVLADCIRRYGFTVPIIIDEDGNLIAGHGRLEAAGELGMTDLPTITIAGLTAAEITALALADNRIAEMAAWDDEILKLELEEILSFDIDPLTLGFDSVEIDNVCGLNGGNTANENAELRPEDVQGPPVTRAGDVFCLGAHRIVCGDSKSRATWMSLMGDKKARLIFTDPPYNVRVDGHVTGLGKTKHREFAMASGEMTVSQFTAFLRAILSLNVEFSVSGSIHYICMDWRHLRELLEASEDVYTELKNLCVWVKTNAGMGSFYRSQHECVAVFKNGTAKHINNFGLGDTGRYRTNVWTYPGMSSMTRERLDDLKLHPTVKPVALVADAIRDCSNRNDIVLDPFCGSGTTIIAAELTGRRAYTIELDPLYVDTAIRRWQRMTGEIAFRASDNAKFTDLEKGQL